MRWDGTGRDRTRQDGRECTEITELNKTEYVYDGMKERQTQ